MKRTINFLLIIFLTSGVCYSGMPGYELNIRNIKFYGCPAKSIEFDLYILHTDTSRFEYAGGQFYFNFNKEISNGDVKLSIVNSGLPKDLQGRMTSVSGDRMGVSTNLPPGPGKGLLIPQDTIEGIKIYTLRITTDGAFNDAPLNIDWRTKGFNPYTKIAAYINERPIEILAQKYEVDSNVEILCDENK